jgi:DNA-binding NarL/FixJ family response regulator
MSGGGTYSMAKLREYLNGTYTKNDESPRAYQHAGLVDGQAGELLSFIESIYSQENMTEAQRRDLPPRFENSMVYQNISRGKSTRQLTEAVKQGNQSIVDNTVGLPNTRSTDISGVATFQSIQEDMREEGVWIPLLFGDMGTGKTDFALLLSELWKDAYRDSQTKMAANIESAEGFDFLPGFEEMIEFVRDGHGRKDKRLLILDEASQFADFQENPKTASALGKMLRLARKSQVSVVFIGHDHRADLAPAIRNVATSIIVKESQKRAKVYDRISSSQKLEDHQRTLTSIPPTSVDYETTEVSTFVVPSNERLDELTEATYDDTDETSEDDSHRADMVEMVGRLSQDGMSYREIAEKIGKSHTTVGQMVSEYQDKVDTESDSQAQDSDS